MPITITPSIVGELDTKSNSNQDSSKDDFRGIVVPGEVIFSSGANLITGHGTYRVDETGGVSEFTQSKDESNQASYDLPMHASMAGRLKSVNKLVYVEPPNARYSGNVGDTVVGRIIEVEQKRWKVDVNSYHLGNLSLANVKLPTGELRRKSESDEREMRSFMREGDLIVAEVREVYRDGSLHLHMPGQRTGRLGEGCVLRLPPSLIRRQKIHRHQLVVPHGSRNTSIGLILGCNGLVWIGPARGMDLGNHLGAKIPTREAPIDQMLGERMAISMVRNVVVALAARGHMVWETAVMAGCEAVNCIVAEERELEGEEEEAMEVEMDAGSSQRHYSTKVEADVISRLVLPEHQRNLVEMVATKLAAG